MEPKNDPVLKKFSRSLQREWEDCCFDLLASQFPLNSFGEPIGSIPRDEVFETVVDLYVGMLSLDSDEYIFWRCMTDEDREVLKKMAFPCESYGH